MKYLSWDEAKCTKPERQSSPNHKIFSCSFSPSPNELAQRSRDQIKDYKACLSSDDTETKCLDIKKAFDSGTGEGKPITRIKRAMLVIRIKSPPLRAISWWQMYNG